MNREKTLYIGDWLAIGDFDGDGHDEALCVTGAVHGLIGSSAAPPLAGRIMSDATLWKLRVTPPPHVITRPVVVDLDGDRRDELVYISGQQLVYGRFHLGAQDFDWWVLAHTPGLGGQLLVGSFRDPLRLEVVAISPLQPMTAHRLAMNDNGALIVTALAVSNAPGALLSVHAFNPTGRGHILVGFDQDKFYIGELAGDGLAWRFAGNRLPIDFVVAVIDGVVGRFLHADRDALAIRASGGVPARLPQPRYEDETILRYDHARLTIATLEDGTIVERFALKVEPTLAVAVIQSVRFSDGRARLLTYGRHWIDFETVGESLKLIQFEAPSLDTQIDVLGWQEWFVSGSRMSEKHGHRNELLAQVRHHFDRVPYPPDDRSVAVLGIDALASRAKRAPLGRFIEPVLGPTIYSIDTLWGAWRFQCTPADQILKAQVTLAPMVGSYTQPGSYIPPVMHEDHSWAVCMERVSDPLEVSAAALCYPYLFACDRTGAVMTSAWAGRWRPWAPLGQLRGAPAAAIYGGRVFVVAAPPNGPFRLHVIEGDRHEERELPVLPSVPMVIPVESSQPRFWSCPTVAVLDHGVYAFVQHNASHELTWICLNDPKGRWRLLVTSDLRCFPVVLHGETNFKFAERDDDFVGVPYGFAEIALVSEGRHLQHAALHPEEGIVLRWRVDGLVGRFGFPVATANAQAVTSVQLYGVLRSIRLFSADGGRLRQTTLDDEPERVQGWARPEIVQAAGALPEGGRIPAGSIGGSQRLYTHTDGVALFRDDGVWIAAQVHDYAGGEKFSDDPTVSAVGDSDVGLKTMIIDKGTRSAAYPRAMTTLQQAFGLLGPPSYYWGLRQLEQFVSSLPHGSRSTSKPVPPATVSLRATLERASFLALISPERGSRG